MKIVIIGGVAAGAKAAAKIKRLLPNSSVDIYTDDTHVSYSACGLPYYIEGNFSDYRALLVRSVEEFKEAGIDVHLKTKVEKILLAQQQVLVCSKLKAKLVPYDKLIITTGARPYIPPILGYGDLNNV
jgi:NADPH-dependent 2,4-dienoyl-CoA reductase/sulfur reductase-like enzyme